MKGKIRINLKISDASLLFTVYALLIKHLGRKYSLVPYITHKLSSCTSEKNDQCRSSCSQMFFEIGALKNLAIITGRDICGSLFFIKLQA